MESKYLSLVILLSIVTVGCSSVPSLSRDDSILPVMAGESSQQYFDRVYEVLAENTLRPINFFCGYSYESIKSSQRSGELTGNSGKFYMLFRAPYATRCISEDKYLGGSEIQDVQIIESYIRRAANAYCDSIAGKIESLNLFSDVALACNVNQKGITNPVFEIDLDSLDISNFKTAKKEGKSIIQNNREVMQTRVHLRENESLSFTLRTDPKKMVTVVKKEQDIKDREAYEKRQSESRKERQKLVEKVRSQISHYQSNLKAGSVTNCGKVVSVTGDIVRVSFVSSVGSRIIEIDRERLYPKGSCSYSPETGMVESISIDESLLK